MSERIHTAAPSRISEINYAALGRAIYSHEGALTQARDASLRVLRHYWDQDTHGDDRYYDQSWEIWRALCELQQAIDQIAENRVLIGFPACFVI